MIPVPANQGVATNLSGESMPDFRRLDWRFLLSEPHVRQVYYHRPENPDLLAALQLAYDDVRYQDEPILDQSIDLAVLRNPEKADLSRVAASLRPGGFLYIEMDQTLWPFARRGRLGPNYPAVLEFLHDLGLASAAAWWHRPDFSSCKEIIPLQQESALSYFFKNKIFSRHKTAALWAGPLSRKSGLLKYLVKSYSIVARKSQRDELSSADYITGYMAKNQQWATGYASGQCKRLTPLFLTPRFDASGHVIALLIDRDDGHPALVAKIHRQPGSSRRLIQEQANLTALQKAWPASAPQTPVLVGYEAWQNHEILLETAVPGVVLKPAWVRRHPTLILSIATNWLAQLHQATLSGDDVNWYRKQIDFPLHRLAALLPEIFDNSPLISATLEKVQPIANLGLPVVFEHGDFSAPNLLLDDRQRLGVVDWENAVAQGLPLMDLFIFLLFHGLCLDQNTNSGNYMQTFAKTFFGPSGRATEPVRRYARMLQIPLAAIKPLFLCAWPRWLDHFGQRLLEVGNDKQIAAQIRANRHFAFWQYALEHWDHLLETVQG